MNVPKLSGVLTRRLTASGLVSLALIVFLPNAAQAKCQIPHFEFDRGAKVPINVTVDRDSGCTISLHAGSGIPEGVNVIIRPHHGHFGKQDTGQYAYVPNRGFVGDDEVAIRIYWHTGHGTGAMVDTWAELDFKIRVVATQ